MASLDYMTTFGRERSRKYCSRHKLTSEIFFQLVFPSNIAHVWVEERERERDEKPVGKSVVFVIYTVIKKSFPAGFNFLNSIVTEVISQVFVVTLDGNIRKQA